MRSGESFQFVVTDLDARVSSGLLSVGSEFQGHKVVGFDRDHEVLLLERAGKTVRLSLRNSRVQEGKSVAAPKVEMKVAIAQDGTLMVNEQAATLESFESALRKHAEGGLPLALFFHQPLDPGLTVHETIKKLHRALAASGVKKWSIKVVDAPPPGG
jgi:biopolymer transport protein ExbD